MKIFRGKSKHGMEIENPLTMDHEVDKSSGESEPSAEEKSSFRIIFAVMALAGLVLFGRVAYLQIVKGEHYKAVAEDNRIRSQVIKAPRGVIADKNGEILARNIPAFDLVFVPIELARDKSKRDSLYEAISGELEMNFETVKSSIESVEKNSTKAYLIKPGIEHRQALVLMEKFQDLQGIYLEKTANREYADGEIFAPIIGYTGKISQEELEKRPNYLMTDSIGKAGLEHAYEERLRGEHGEIRTEVDSSGNIKENLGFMSPVQGDKLVLNIDAKLQKKAYETLRAILEKNEEATGAAIAALNPRDGSVLSLASLPSYDNNFFSGGISSGKYSELLNDPAKPMLNRAIAGEYPPGSTFKPLVAAAGLEEGLVEEDTVIECQGEISHGSWTFRDWKTHGKTDLEKGIAESCNVYFYSLGGGWNNIEGLGPQRMSKYARYFGLGSPLGLDLPGESSGNVPDKEWKFQKFGDKWYIGDSYHMAIGQGFVSATPLQMAGATSVIANGGKLYKPWLVNEIIKSDGGRESMQKELVGEGFVSSEHIKSVKEAMRETIVSGSGTSLNNMETEVGGKTGTAQYGSEEKTHSWFVSFAPYENPEIAMAVLVEGGGEGHDWAVPATEAILRDYFGEEEEDIDFGEIQERVENR
ncbi:MAG: penicillin-binding protein 2 [Candidatus Moranbacteria bacterium]|nr:penicillin-binding protein 2 [Candidatus Moranbacteria bacterium]